MLSSSMTTMVEAEEDAQRPQRVRHRGAPAPAPPAPPAGLTVLDVRGAGLLRLHGAELAACSHSLEAALLDDNRLVHLTGFSGASFPRLRLLSAAWNSLMSAPALLRRAPALRALNLSANNIDAAQLAAALDCGAGARHVALRTLDCDRNNVERLVNLRALAALRRLRLADNDVRGIREAAALLPPSLEELSLSGARVDSMADVRALGRALPRLRALAVEGCPLLARGAGRGGREGEEDARARIVRALPGLAALNGERVEEIMRRSRGRLTAELAMWKLIQRRRCGRPTRARAGGRPGGAPKSRGAAGGAVGSLEWLLREAARVSPPPPPGRARGGARGRDAAALVLLRAAVRGWLVRRRFRTFIEANSAATSIQAHWRGYRCRAQSRPEPPGAMPPPPLSECRERILRLELSEKALRAELREERERRAALGEEHRKLEEAVRVLWGAVVGLQQGTAASV